MQEYWGTGEAGYGTPFRLCAVVNRKIAAEGGYGVLIVLLGPAQTWLARLRPLSSLVVELHPDGEASLLHAERGVNER